jgi:hydroxymethylpyrimidine pyrophosphatase-like HAD family hydrolase
VKDYTEISVEEAKSLKGIMADIDDTLTVGGRLTLSAYKALWKAHNAGLYVIPITGSPAGWCDMIARQ